MDVMVVRHGIALDREDAGIQAIAEEDRPLTRKGRTRTKRVAKGLVARAPGVISLLTSPLRRAVETAEILGKAYDLDFEETRALLPEADPAELSRLLSDDGGISPVAVVGHEPHLSRWVGWSLTGTARSIIDLRKAGVCLVRFEDAPAASKGRLLWLMPPSMLQDE